MLKETLSIIRNNKIILMIFYIITPLILTLCIMRNLYMPEFDTCFADAFCTVSGSVYESIIPFTVFICIYMVRYQIQTPVVIRYVDIRKVWLNLCKKITVLTLVMSFYILLCTILIDFILVKTKYNWNMKNSIFYFSTTKVKDEISYPMLFFIFFTSTFFAILLFNLFTMLIYWIFHSMVLGYILCIVVIVEEQVSWNPFLVSRISAGFKIWLKPVNFMNQLGFPLLIMLLLICSGYFFIKQRDFLNHSKAGEQV